MGEKGARTPFARTDQQIPRAASPRAAQVLRWPYNVHPSFCLHPTFQCTLHTRHLAPHVTVLRKIGQAQCAPVQPGCTVGSHLGVKHPLAIARHGSKSVHCIPRQQHYVTFLKSDPCHIDLARMLLPVMNVARSIGVKSALRWRWRRRGIRRSRTAHPEAVAHPHF